MFKVLKSTENINPSHPKSSNGKTMLLSKRALFGSKKLKFIKEQACGLLSSLGIKTPLSKTPLLDNVLF